LIVGAPFTAPICALLLLWWLVLPLAEEPWLRTRFGDEYQQYAQHVPRFVGWTTVRRLLDNTTRRSETPPEP
jgi:protein-S-isoprenylcysteine O-methyltransferase Ste14